MRPSSQATEYILPVDRVILQIPNISVRLLGLHTLTWSAGQHEKRTLCMENAVAVMQHGCTLCVAW